MDITLQDTALYLKELDNYLILTHRRPDGDTIGCAIALCLGLRRLGKRAYVLPNEGATALFAPYWGDTLAPEGFVPSSVVAVDMAARSMFPVNAKGYLERVDLTIDHHESQEFYAKETCVDPDRAACGQIVLDVVKRFAKITPEIGQALYVAVSTDCGCFQYSNTDGDAHRAAAELIDSGFDLYPVNRLHFRTKSFKRLKLESLLVQGLELRDGGTTAIACLTREMIDGVGADERDMEDISAFVGQIEGVKSGVTLKETTDGHVKISLRTDPGDLNASKVCNLLGGGGHAAASGAMVKGTMEEVRRRVIQAIEAVRAD